LRESKAGNATGVWLSLLEFLRRRRGTPQELLAEVGVAKGMKMADIGAGYGFFAFPAAEIVGEVGLVYAVEPNPKRAEEIRRRAEERGVKNLRVLVAGREEIVGMQTGAVELAISMSSFHHFADPKKALAELRRIVKPGGLVYIRDIKPGRLFKHGSKSEEFRADVRRQFPDAEFEEGSGYLVGGSDSERCCYGLGALSLAVPPTEKVSRNSRLKSEAAAEFLTSSSPSLRAASRVPFADWLPIDPSAAADSWRTIGSLSFMTAVSRARTPDVRPI
jgi:SAM-dependent methyltransferase